MNRWLSQNLCLTIDFWKRIWGVILPSQAQPHQTHSWVSFLAQMTEMKPVQYIVTVVVVLVVLVQQAVLVQMTCGPCILTDPKHRMALNPGAF